MLGSSAMPLSVFFLVMFLSMAIANPFPAESDSVLVGPEFVGYNDILESTPDGNIETQNPPTEQNSQTLDTVSDAYSGDIGETYDTAFSYPKTSCDFCCRGLDGEPMIDAVFKQRCIGCAQFPSIFQCIYTNTCA